MTDVQQPHDCLLLCVRYRQKRHERNFTKRIKYMCRKTLADTRPRVRGRFARNNDAGAVMPHETKKALAAKAKAGKAAAAAQSQQMQGTSAAAHLPCLRTLLCHQVVSVLSGMMVEVLRHCYNLAAQLKCQVYSGYVYTGCCFHTEVGCLASAHLCLNISVLS